MGGDLLEDSIIGQLTGRLNAIHLDVLHTVSRGSIALESMRDQKNLNRAHSVRALY
jgi:hypothetical protein